MIKFNPDKIRNLINERRRSDTTFRQGRFLEEIKLSLTGLNKILDGKSEPGVDTLSRIASYFGKDMNYFFDNIASPEEMSRIEGTVTNNEFLLNRIEKMAVQINKLEEELKDYRSNEDTSYTLQNVPHFKTPKTETKLKKTDQTQTKTKQTN